ncbi:Nuclear RNA export factor [Schistosoma haematobium]|uniref:Nuclear RNA export factor n=1 Tax=Schistosoma haematobium TaxID=6185 RepID=A0A922LS47_SCHHA|nr:Nuclear RNA export factor [Schistosoma haematobium]KAH9592136.1 Nuclear RNA export factor [Schistosoma haematobium]CAH8675583.1 unnamed protein product [Schistosoma haematobium]CAH8679276.1 unnamed protein product [Schistosoma haematobium]
MPHGNHRNKSNHYRWRSHGENDRRIDTSDEYLRRREHGGKFSSGRKSIISGNNVDMLKRAMNMNLIGGSAASVVTAQNSGLAPGEVWVRITIVHGANHPMMDLQQLVTTIVGTQLRFYNTCVEGRNALMHAKIRQKDVQSYRKSLQNLRDPSQGSQLITDITIVPEPRVPSSSDKRNESPNTSPLPETWIEALKQCFVQRYQPTTRSLDLSSLHTDPVLLSQGLYLPLNKQAVVHTLITILKQNQAQLAVLNLSNNRLTHLNAFSPLSSTSAGFIPVSIERIDLSSNPLSSIPVLSGLRDIVGLVELDLTETPLMSKFNPNDKSFAAKLHTILPTIKRLNGQELPQTVQFAIEQGSDSSKRPPTKPLPQSILGFFPNDEVKIALLSFLKLYLSRYDSKPRGESLLPYYTTVSQLVFSVSPENRFPNSQNVSFTARVEIQNGSDQPTTAYLTTSRLNQAYFLRSRNLLRCRDQSRRRDMVVRGSLAIAHFLDELPTTEHQLESLSVDVAFHSGTQMLFTMGGVFYEVSSMGSSSTNSSSHEKSVRKVLRCFTRTMILIAPGGHIVQDDYIVSNPTTSLCKKYITEMATRCKQDSQASNQQQNVLSSDPSAPEVKENIVIEFSRRTGMNIPFSRQCLEEYEWNANAALTAFETMNLAGKIPPEAFSV